MANEIFERNMVKETVASLNIANLSSASIGEVLSVAMSLEAKTGIPFIRMDQGVPGLPAGQIGIEAEKAALDRGVGNMYPPMMGIPELKNAASRFMKAFLNIDIAPKSCIPATGSASVSFVSFAATTQRIAGKNKVLFIDPGFSVQKAQLNILGIPSESFDVYAYRGQALEAKLRSYLDKGDIAALLYSNPNNPAWISLNEEELQIIGRLATEYDVVVLEDLAYFCMDNRQDFSKPNVAPYPPTVARYTDNYIIMASASKMFSYAGQRLGLACISDSLFNRKYPALAERYHDSGIFGLTFATSILYTLSAGCTMSTQYGVAAMLNAAADGEYDFVHDVSIYARRAERMKKMLSENGFHIVYDKDCDRTIGDGFFFTVGYKNMTCSELMEELLYYGISSISLSTTGSGQEGIRACTSKLTDDMFPLFEDRLKRFAMDHR